MYMYTCMYIFLHTCTFVYKNTYLLYVCIQTHIYTYIIFVYLYIHIYMYIYIHIYICMYTYIYIYKYKYAISRCILTYRSNIVSRQLCIRAYPINITNYLLILICFGIYMCSQISESSANLMCTPI